MIDFHKFFLNPLDDKGISLTEELTYAAAQINVMTADNPGGALDARIAATTTATGALEGGATDEGVKLALQKARTLSKKNFRDTLTPKIAQVHAAVVSAFGPDSPEVMECFPEGRTVYSNCRDEQLNQKLEGLVTAITPKQAQVGAPAVTLATALKNNWAALFGSQGTAKAQTDASGVALDAARATLKLELFRNLLTLALMFPGDIAKCDLYCPQHLLRNPQHANTPGDATLNAGAYNAGTQHLTLSMHSAGATTFDLGRRTVGEPDFTIIATDLAASTGGNATYQDTIAPGDYEYRAVPKKNGVAGNESDIVTVNAA
ncbi:MAG: hypothetical protein HY301_00920 [Verrucomicrobia bacterium]|nr:hypothetical protein [Verrucomicrobiota bacterium]